MPVIVVHEDARFQTELANAGNNLVVVDFTASWCGPCQRIAPVFEELSNKYSRGAVFLKVDVDQCPDTAVSQNVSAMPTFIFCRNKVKLGSVRGADPEALEFKIKEYIGNVQEGGASGSEVSVPGHVDLATYINKAGSEALNESDDHPLSHCLASDESQFLESDCDEQLIINLQYTQTVKLHSIMVKGPSDKGPKTIKLFINQPKTPDFDQADSMNPVQEITCSEKELSQGVPIGLRYVRFQNVGNLMLFIKDNQAGAETTVINHLAVIGSPVSTTNMGDFKRIAGKKGESH